MEAEEAEKPGREFLHFAVPLRVWDARGASSANGVDARRRPPSLSAIAGQDKLRPEMDRRKLRIRAKYLPRAGHVGRRNAKMAGIPKLGEFPS